MKIFLSPNSTKLLLYYNKTDGTQGVTGRDIDYTQSTASALQFQNETNFIQSIKDVNFTE